MNGALKKLRDAKPELFDTLLDALGEDLGLPNREPLAGFTCPNCQAQFDVVLSENRRSGKGRAKRRMGTDPNSLFNLLVQLARVRKTTTGKLNAEFSKTMGKKTKGMKNPEVRELKIAWIREQIAKGKSKVA